MADPNPATVEERMTAPQSPYSLRHVAIGILVLLIGVLIAFVLPTIASGL